MKKQISTVFVLLGLLATITAPSIGAQLADVTVQADIPFSFTVGDTTLPPGKYLIKDVDPSNPEILEIRSADGKTAVVRIGRPTTTAKAPQRPQLSFQRIGDRYFLSQIWLESGEGVELDAANAERKLVEKGEKLEMQSVPAQQQKGKRMKN